MAELKLDLPPDLLEVLKSLGDPQQAIKECVVLELYRRGEISSGKAAELLGMSRLEFIQYSGRLGIPFFRYSPEELEAELRDLEGLSKK
jgi:predicted HTH domain antitoxin